MDRRRPTERRTAVHVPTPATRSRTSLHRRLLPVVESGDADYAAFHVVTVGDAASQRERELFAEDRYQEYLLCHGLSVEMTEALADCGAARPVRSGAFPERTAPPSPGSSASSTAGSGFSVGPALPLEPAVAPRWAAAAACWRSPGDGGAVLVGEAAPSRSGGATRPASVISTESP